MFSTRARMSPMDKDRIWLPWTTHLIKCRLQLSNQTCSQAYCTISKDKRIKIWDLIRVVARTTWTLWVSPWSRSMTIWWASSTLGTMHRWWVSRIMLQMGCSMDINSRLIRATWVTCLSSNRRARAIISLTKCAHGPMLHARRPLTSQTKSP